MYFSFLKAAKMTIATIISSNNIMVTTLKISIVSDPHGIDNMIVITDKAKATNDSSFQLIMAISIL